MYDLGTVYIYQNVTTIFGKLPLSSSIVTSKNQNDVFMTRTQLSAFATVVTQRWQENQGKAWMGNLITTDHDVGSGLWLMKH